MGIRWDDDEFDSEPWWPFEPLPRWALVLIGVAVGFALCFLTFVPM